MCELEKSLKDIYGIQKLKEKLGELIKDGMIMYDVQKGILDNGYEIIKNIAYTNGKEIVLEKESLKREIIQYNDAPSNLGDRIEKTEAIYFDEDGVMHELKVGDKILEEKIEKVKKEAEEKGRHKTGNFFKLLLNKTNLLQDSSDLKIEEIKKILDSISEKKVKFMEKYPSKKSKSEEQRDAKQQVEPIPPKKDGEKEID